MINRDITFSNNLVHDLGVDYRGIVVGPHRRTSPTSTMSHNEVYNMPYSGMTIGYGWGANDAGGSKDYANRGLYNYQPRYTTATTATQQPVTGNYIHDVMQQMTDGGCIYTPVGVARHDDQRELLPRTNGWFGLYFDEGSRYFTATNNVFDEHRRNGPRATTGPNNNTGNLTLTNNWTTNSGTNVTTGDRGNVVTGTSWSAAATGRRGAQSVMASAGIQSSTAAARRRRSWAASPAGASTCPNASTTNGTQVQLWDCHGGTNQRWTYTAGRQLMVYGNKCLDASGQGTANGTAVIIWDCNGQTNQQWNVNANGTITGVQSGPVPGRQRRRHRQRHARSSCGPATAAPTSSGRTRPTHPRRPRRRRTTAAARRAARATSTPPAARHASPRTARPARLRRLQRHLYQVRRSSDNTTRNIGVLTAGGAANAAAQDSFCAGTTCVITVVYDQSGTRQRPVVPGIQRRARLTARAARRSRPPSR